jgi:hypothetical protein
LNVDYIIKIRKEGFNMKKLVLLMAVGVMLMFGSFAFAAPAVDVVQAPTGYFVPTDGQKYDTPTYWRGYGQDWGWTHNAIGGTITSASLNISAFDVDASSGEVDNIYAYDGSNRVLLGSLAGANDVWAFTNFVLGANFFDDIASGLKVEIEIDVVTKGDWLVTLSKSALSVDGGILPDPDPGAVPEPLTLLLLGLGLTGIAGTRRFTK